MKTCIVAMLVCAAFVSCKKSNNAGEQLIAGKWELRQSSGGIGGTINYPAGNGTVYTFDNNRGYKYDYSAAGYTGTYEIKTSGHPGDWLLQLKYTLNGQTLTEKDSVRFNASQLIFISMAPEVDRPTFSFERIP